MVRFTVTVHLGHRFMASDGNAMASFGNYINKNRITCGSLGIDMNTHYLDLATAFCQQLPLLMLPSQKTGPKHPKEQPNNQHHPYLPKSTKTTSPPKKKKTCPLDLTKTRHLWLHFKLHDFALQRSLVFLEPKWGTPCFWLEENGLVLEGWHLQK